MPTQPLPRIPLPHVVAVVGCDGSGKSTLTADIVAAMQATRPTEFVYLGQSSGNIMRAIVKLPLIGGAVGRALVRRSERVHARGGETGGPKAPPDLLAAIVIFLLSRWRFHKFRKVVAMSRRGQAVITDRYPQAEVPGFYFDGPELPRNPGDGAFVRWLARREQRLYARMASHVPALVIRLNVDAETAQRRKSDHKLAMLREKVDVIPTLHFNGARVLDFDGRSNYPAVFDAALSAARLAL